MKQCDFSQHRGKTTMMAFTTAILGLRTLIKAIVPEKTYPTKSWVTSDLQPVLHTIASKLEDLHRTDDVNSGEDYVTRVTTAVILAFGVIWLFVITWWLINLGRTVSKIGEGLSVVATKVQIPRTEEFPTVKF